MRFILILALPFLELWLMIKVGAQIGALATIGLLFLSAMAGLALLRRQGLSTLLNMNRKVAAGEKPEAIALEGMILAAAGLLFIFPGFITDVMGFICLLPFARRFLARRWLKNFQSIHVAHFSAQGASPNEQNPSYGQDNIYEAEYREVTLDPTPTLPLPGEGGKTNSSP